MLLCCYYYHVFLLRKQRVFWFSGLRSEELIMELSSDDRVNLVLWVSELELDEGQKLALSDMCMRCERNDDACHKKIKTLKILFRQQRCGRVIFIPGLIAM